MKQLQFARSCREKPGEIPRTLYPGPSHGHSLQNRSAVSQPGFGWRYRREAGHSVGTRTSPVAFLSKPPPRPSPPPGPRPPLSHSAASPSVINPGSPRPPRWGLASPLSIIPRRRPQAAAGRSGRFCFSPAARSRDGPGFAQPFTPRALWVASRSWPCAYSCSTPVSRSLREHVPTTPGSAARNTAAGGKGVWPVLSRPRNRQTLLRGGRLVCTPSGNACGTRLPRLLTRVYFGDLFSGHLCANISLWVLFAFARRASPAGSAFGPLAHSRVQGLLCYSGAFGSFPGARHWFLIGPVVCGCRLPDRGRPFLLRTEQVCCCCVWVSPSTSRL